MWGISSNMEQNNAEVVEANAEKEIVVESNGMSYGTIKRVVGDRVKMEDATGNTKSESISSVVSWINADYTTLQ